MVCDVGEATQDIGTIDNIEVIVHGMVSKFEGVTKRNGEDITREWVGLHGSRPHHCLAIKLSPRNVGYNIYKG